MLDIGYFAELIYIILIINKIFKFKAIQHKDFHPIAPSNFSSDCIYPTQKYLHIFKKDLYKAAKNTQVNGTAK